uniref:Uncharacterized protein n=1 Tax=Panagrolaimus sp. ES5 TaxID=591445 RepID=A0AC34F063_9BILA
MLPFKAGFIVKEDYQKKGNKNSWNKSGFDTKVSKDLNSFDEEKKVQKRWKNDNESSSTNNSTLSLHIAAYENAIEDSSESQDSTEKVENGNALLKDLFEFPRQMENNESTTPEIMQFKASQQLLNPNQADSLNQNVPRMAEFTFDGKVKTLQVATLTPTMLARVFRLDENSLVLTDKDGFCYMPEDGKFVPSLESNKSYEVDGVELATTNSSTETQIALKNMNNDLKVIQGSQRFDLIQGVIETCKDMNESANMLYHGPQAVVLVQSLAILAVCAPDPSLDVATLKPEIKNRLADPGSFRASLLHVANKMCNAFREADKTMKTIRASLVDFPDYFSAAIEVLGQNDDDKTKKILLRIVGKIKNSSDTCTKSAASVQNTFADVMKDIDALSEAACSCKTVNEREKIELKKLKDEMEIQREANEAHHQQLEEEYEEDQARCKEMLQDYRTQMANSTDLGKIFLATLADGVMDLAKTGAQLLPSNIIKNAANAMNPFGQEYIKCSHAMKVGVENGLIKCLEEVGQSLSDPLNLDDETLGDYIASLKDFQKYSAATTEGMALFDQARKVEKILKKYKASLENGGGNVDKKMKAEISAIKISIQNAVRTICLAQEQQKRDEAATSSLREQMLRADAVSLRFVSQNLLK